MRILIVTGIYPPAIGGPAQYAKNMKEEWKKMGHEVRVKTYDFEHYLPSGIRHIYFSLKIIASVIWSDFIFALDTFSVGMPATFMARFFGKKIIIRAGGDFLWEGYVERTKDLVLFRDFYQRTKRGDEGRDEDNDRNEEKNREKWSMKERIIFNLTKWTLHYADTLIFSTAWQKNVWMCPYDLANVRTEIIENYYGKKEKSFEPSRKYFIAGTRKLKWKNLDFLSSVFEGISDASLDMNNYTHGEFMKRILECYAVILISLGDISPNMILESIRCNKPFIITKENGLMNRIGNIAIIADPKNLEDVREKVLWLIDDRNYNMQVEKIKNFTFTHSWEEIAKEILEINRKS